MDVDGFAGGGERAAQSKETLCFYLLCPDLPNPPPNFRPLTGSVRAADCPVGCHTAPRSWAALDSVGAGGGLTCDSGEASLCPRQAPGTVGIVYVASARPEQTFNVFPVGVGSGCKTHCLSKEGNPFSGC